MNYGARNKIKAKVANIKKGEIMSLIKCRVEGPVTLSSVITAESLENLGLKAGDEVTLVVKAVNVLPVK